MLLTAKLNSNYQSFTQRIWYILITCAYKKQTISYRDLLKSAGKSGDEMHELFNALTKIGNIEEKNNRPWVNALAVGYGNIPGTGFFNWVKAYCDEVEFKKFTKEELFNLIKEDCFEFWSNQSNFLEHKDLELF